MISLILRIAPLCTMNRRAPQEKEMVQNQNIMSPIRKCLTIKSARRIKIAPGAATCETTCSNTQVEE